MYGRVVPRRKHRVGEIRGGAPATRETDLLRPGMSVEAVHAVVLTGGSAFGLAAADGVMRFLEEKGIGQETPVLPVPIVPTASLFDLGIGDPMVRPTAADGYAAAASATDSTLEGNVGAGTGATVAKGEGLEGAVKGGLGSSSVTRDGITVGAIVAVNAVGEIIDEDGTVIAGVRGTQGGDRAGSVELLPGTNTTIGVVATDAVLTRERANLLAAAAHEGMDLSTKPAHTPWDGDALFSLATGQAGEAPQAMLEEMAVQVVADAIRRGARAAASVPGAPAAGGTA